MYLIFVVFGLIAVGVGAGYFLAMGPIIILTAIGVALLVFLNRETKDVPAGTSGGLAVGIMMFAVWLVIVPMWITAGAVRIGPFVPPDLSGIGRWFLR